MKIKIINPDYGVPDESMGKALSILRCHVSCDTSLSMSCLVENQVYIDSMADVVLAGSEVLSMAKKAERDGFDAVVLYCFSDPAISACREALNIPVIGGGQSAYLTALNISRQFGIIITDKGRIGEKKLFVHETGIAPERVAGITSACIDFSFLEKDFEKAVNSLEEAGKRLIDLGADTIILGCLSFLGMGETLSRKLGIPVIDPAISAVSMAESLVRQNLKTSKAGYSKPPVGKRLWNTGEFIIE